MAKRLRTSLVVLGVDELGEDFAKLRKAASRDQLIDALRVAGQIIADEAQRLVTSDRVRDRIYVRDARQRKLRSGAMVEVAVSGQNYRIAHLIEFGTAAHTVKSAKVVLTNQSAFFGKVVRHPGTMARPFMRPAYDTKKIEAINAAKRVLREAITRGL